MKKSSFYHTPLHSTPPLWGFLSEYRHPLWCRKTRMLSLPDSEKILKIFLFVLTWSTNVTDGQTDRRTLHDSKDRACIASRGKNYMPATANALIISSVWTRVDSSPILSYFWYFGYIEVDKDCILRLRDSLYTWQVKEQESYFSLTWHLWTSVIVI